MATYSLPQTEDFSSGTIGKMSTDYAATCTTVEYDTTQGNWLTGGKALKAVFVGDQSLAAYLELTAAVPEIWMGCWMKGQMDAIGDASDQFSWVRILGDLGGIVLNPYGEILSANGTPFFDVAYQAAGPVLTSLGDTGGAFMDGLWHHYLLGWKYGAGTGEVHFKIDGAEVCGATGLTMEPTEDNVLKAGIRIRDIDAGNNMTLWFGRFTFTATEPDAESPIYLARRPRLITYV